MVAGASLMTAKKKAAVAAAVACDREKWENERKREERGSSWPLSLPASRLNRSSVTESR
jgi:hypothetical protein